ncbi:hypothetical protein D3C86_1973760 [compost metagenome]
MRWSIDLRRSSPRAQLIMGSSSQRQDNVAMTRVMTEMIALATRNLVGSLMVLWSISGTQ